MIIVLIMYIFMLMVSAKDSDIIDEAISYFKANVFFKNYEIKVRFLSASQKAMELYMQYFF